VLILDEPTNHLDLESREALEAALQAFKGSVLLVSHDRALLDAVAHRLLAIEDQAVNSYDGGWAEYARRREEPVATPPAKKREKARAAAPKPSRARPSALESLESEISAQEEEVAALERKLAEDWSDVETLSAHRRARDELQELLSRWEQLFDEAQA
jgi:ATP-binding cassette, subfamily F, member 3